MSNEKDEDDRQKRKKNSCCPVTSSVSHPVKIYVIFSMPMLSVNNANTTENNH